MKKKVISVLTVSLLFSIQLFSQQTEDFARLMNDPNSNFFEVQKAFNAFHQRMEEEHGQSERWYKKWRKEGEEEEESGYEIYKRWEYFMQSRVDANGKLPDPALVWNEWQKHHQQENSTAKLIGNNQTLSGSTWSHLGPVGGEPTGGGSGRLTFIRFDPTNNNTIWVGAPAGGLWKSTNNGQTWSTATDALAVIGCSDLAIDPTNTNIMYLATGDRDAGDTYSIGVLKSIDGGLTWNTTGLSSLIPQQKTVSALLINPTNTSMVLAATSSGIYRTQDGGVNWQLEKTGSFKDMEYRPGDPTTVYAAGQSFFKSVDSGDNWAVVNVGTNIDRMAIAVTPADSDYVYILASQPAANNYGFNGIYRSTNSGASFTQMCTTPNILGWSNNGSDAGGQGWYDLAIAASYTNKDFIVTGGVNIWKSSNGGATMQIMAHWTGSGAPYVHADVHTVEFLPGSGSTVFAGCDGGLFRTTNTGSSWSDIGNSTTGTGLQIGQIYRLGVSQTNANLTMTGWQDNGCSLFNNGTGGAARVLGGDGMEVLIDYSNASIMYGEQYNGNIWKSTNGGGSFNNNIAGTGATGVDEDGDWVTPYIIHPTTPSTLLVGKKQVYKSTNGGTSFSTLTLPGTGTTSNVVALAYAPSNPNYIYAAKTSELHISTNGSTFTNITSLIPTGGISSICVDPANPQRLWYTVAGQISGYSPGAKVFYSANAGQTWTNISYNLPNLPVNTIVYQPGTSDGLYVGTDVGVYYKDNSMTNWIYYSAGLPNVVVDELEIQQSTGKLRAATYGRGLWEVNLYTTPTSVPVVAFSSNKTTVCKNGNVDFYDNSTNFPASWSWTFAGGTPATSALQFPTINYATPGTYQVKLVATNAAGTDSLIQSTYITVLPAPPANAGADQRICKGDTAYLSASGGTAYTWSAATFLNNSQIQSPFSTTTGTRTYTVTVGDANGCTATDAVTIFVTLPPTTPGISVIQPDSLSASSTNVFYQWYYNGSIIPTGTTKHIYAPLNGAYSVVVTDTAGCGFSATSTNFNYVGIKKISLQDNLAVYPNPSKGNFEISIFSETENSYMLRIYNAIGECLYNETISASSGNFKKAVSLNLPGGSYILELSDPKTKQKAVRKLAVINP